MWLDRISADASKDSFQTRYMENKRGATTHPQGWDEQWACHTCTVTTTMTTSGNLVYQKLAFAEKRLITARQQTLQLSAQDANVPRPADKRRVGQRVAKEKPKKKKK